jgi:hypothetical protein
MPVRKIAIGALPIAIGGAIQVSGFGGEVAVLVGWGSVALVLLGLGAHYMWVRRRSAAHTAARLARKVGRELVRFAQTRYAVAPSRKRKRRWMPRTLDALRSHGRDDSEHAYDTDTMTLFHEHFADSVYQAVGRLRRAGRIGAGEAEALISMPTGPAAIEKLGHRLIELGYED